MHAMKESRELDRQDRIAWQQEQEAKFAERQADMERQIAELKNEMSMMRASMVMPQIQQQPAIMSSPSYLPLPAPAAHIEEVPAQPEEDHSMFMAPLTPMSQAAYRSPDLPAFVEGSSSRPMSMPLSPPVHTNASPRFLPTPVTPRPPPATGPSLYTPVSLALSHVSPTPVPAHAALSPRELPPYRVNTLPSPAQTPVVAPAQPSSGRHKRHTPPPASNAEEDTDSDSDVQSNPKRRKTQCSNIQVSIFLATRVYLTLFMLLVCNASPYLPVHAN
jgi:hypothetical protein